MPMKIVNHPFRYVERMPSLPDDDAITALEDAEEQAFKSARRRVREELWSLFRTCEEECVAFLSEALATSLRDNDQSDGSELYSRMMFLVGVTLQTDVVDRENADEFHVLFPLGLRGHPIPGTAFRYLRKNCFDNRTERQFCALCQEWNTIYSRTKDREWKQMASNGLHEQQTLFLFYVMKKLEDRDDPYFKDMSALYAMEYQL